MEKEARFTRMRQSKTTGQPPGAVSSTAQMKSCHWHGPGSEGSRKEQGIRTGITFITWKTSLYFHKKVKNSGEFFQGGGL